MRVLFGLIAIALSAPALAGPGISGSASMCVRGFSLRDLNPFDGISARWRESLLNGETEPAMNPDSELNYVNSIVSFRGLGNFDGEEVRLRTITGEGGESFAHVYRESFWNSSNSSNIVELSPYTAYTVRAVARGSFISTRSDATGSWRAAFGGGSDIVGGRISGIGTYSAQQDMSFTWINDTDQWQVFFPWYYLEVDIFTPN